MAAAQNPLTVGGALAVLAAVAFGLTTPVIKHFGAASGPFTTAGLLYAGAAAASVWPRGADTAPVLRPHAPRLLLVALIGAVVAPACLAWGLHRTSASAASLLLNFEAVFTVGLARVFYREAIGRRVALAVFLMVLGGALLVTGGRLLTFDTGLGSAAVLAACLAWASDNTLTQPLSNLDPRRVVFWKATIGAVLSFVVSRGLSERIPPMLDALVLLVCGAGGYGLSLRLYLLAQRRIGAARTGSVFAVAPFVGAVAAWGTGDRGSGMVTLVAGILFAIAVALHLTERHGHEHHHERHDHEHAHRHDDGHHEHTHDVYPDGEHTHLHRHDALSHAHPHGPDVHHRHSH